MSVSGTSTRKTFAGNGSTSTFYALLPQVEYAATTEIQGTADGVALANGVDFTVHLTNGVQTTVAYASGVSLVFDRVTPLTQPTALSSSETPSGGTVETALDRLLRQIQERGSGGTETIAGLLQIATIAETNTGTVREKAVSPYGLEGSALQIKVDGIESLATADQTAAEIRALVEAAVDSHVFTNADHTKLGILGGVVTIAISDELTELTTGPGKATFRMPFAMTVTEVRASVTAAPTGAVLTFDINEGGSTILSTKLTIDATEKTSTTAAAAAVISGSALADDAEISIDIDTIGSSIPGAGAKITLIGTRP